MSRTAALLLLVISGCSVASAPPDGAPATEQAPQPADHPDVPTEVAEPLPDTPVDTVPPEDDARGGQARTPLVRGLEQVLDESPVFEDAGDDLREQLLEADQILDQVKRENLEALRQMNRQVIVGPQPPNIVLLVADDLGFGDLGCYGQSKIQTPHIDRMASEGMRLNQFYAGGVTSDSSWWCLMTGLYTARYGAKSNSRYAIAPQRVTLAETMWQGGYETGFVGNWYLAGAGNPEMPHEHGFDEWSGTMLTDDSLTHYPESLWSDGVRAKVRSNLDGQQGVHIDEYFAGEAISFLRRRRNGKPFLLVVSFTLAHKPLAAPVADLYEEQPWGEAHRVYAAMVSRLDHYVGSILDELAKLGLDENTVVLLTSDNAADPGDETVSEFFSSRGDLRGELGELYEGGIRVPMIVRWPRRIPAGSTSSFPSALWDLLPTFAEWGRVRRRPRPVDGTSLVRLLQGEELTVRKQMYWQSPVGGRAQAVRIGPDCLWKAIRPAGKETHDAIELYDLTNDAREASDVADKNPDAVARAISKS